MPGALSLLNFIEAVQNRIGMTEQATHYKAILEVFPARAIIPVYLARINNAEWKLCIRFAGEDTQLAFSI